MKWYHINHRYQGKEELFKLCSPIVLENSGADGSELGTDEGTRGASENNSSPAGQYLIICGAYFVQAHKQFTLSQHFN